MEKRNYEEECRKGTSVERLNYTSLYEPGSLLRYERTKQKRITFIEILVQVIKIKATHKTIFLEIWFLNLCEIVGN